MRAFTAKVAQNVFVVAACVLQGVGEDRHPVEGFVGVDALGKTHSRVREPNRVDRDETERVVEHY